MQRSREAERTRKSSGEDSSAAADEEGAPALSALLLHSPYGPTTAPAATKGFADHRDMGLREGEKIRINFGKGASRVKTGGLDRAARPTAIAPPPAAMTSAPQTQTTATDAEEEEDWGEFSGAT
jgi:hypothetical protein